jgi:CRISPR system Cascade subunit CasA
VRLLVALLKDIYEPQGLRDWQAIWARGSFDPQTVDSYFEKHDDRFDLFHPKYPFYQTAGLEDDNPVNLNLFASELATGNNPTLFDHSLDTVETDYTPVQAFHLLLAAQSFSLAGLLRRTTRLKGEAEPIYWQSAYSAPMIPGAMIWITGDNLFETLALNLAPLERLDDEDEDGETAQDAPAWKLDKPAQLRDRLIGKQHLKEPARGTRDRLTWQSRLIRLLPVETEKGVVVRSSCFNHGRSADNGQLSFDPMLAYRSGKKEGLYVVRLSQERAPWRDAHSLIGLNKKGVRQTPRALSLLSTAQSRKTPGLNATRLLRLNVAGLANDQAKVLLWRHDRLDAPAVVLYDPEKVEQIGALLNEAEKVAELLRGATRRLCENFLAPMMHDPTGKIVEGAMKADTDRVSDLADCIDPRTAYWARLESGFHHLLLHLAEDETTAANLWKDRVTREAQIAFEEAVERLGDSPKTGKAAALAHPYFVVPSRQPPPPPKGKSRKEKAS